MRRVKYYYYAEWINPLHFNHNRVFPILSGFNSRIMDSGQSKKGTSF